MKLTIIFAAILVALVAVRNLWLAFDNRKEKLKLKDYRRELDSREIQLNLQEIAIEQGLEAMKKTERGSVVGIGRFQANSRHLCCYSIRRAPVLNREANGKRCEKAPRSHDCRLADTRIWPAGGGDNA